ncbi:hypothetical protein GFB69_11205 [Acidianus ambivalens]|uniref:DUF5658 domain-containing protein n=1 Tax=Acidianus ambivalens TaxID=2283 RepID=A0A650CYB9_ACIAM|nr:hypothetical protein [Acidianus ambivalens]QGR22840.1 hypothetical protein D1866_03625 [Acidianus ambivalens]
MSIIYEIIMFYGFQFDDYWTTILGIKRGAEEKNPIASPFASSPLLLALYKFGLGTFAAILIVQFPALNILLFIDTIFEAIITFNNIFELNKIKRKERG